jgi:sortase B
MRKLLDKLAGMSKRQRAGFLALAATAILCFGVLLVSAIQITSTLVDRYAAEQEYGGLREQYAPNAEASAVVPINANRDESKKELWEINPDYVGWLAIPGAEVDYPVARGADNTKYLGTSFEGSASELGSIFMDRDNTDGFASRHAVIYGHDMNDGQMFGRLKRYLDAGFLADNPNVTVTLADGSQQTYRIFSARLTDAWDAAYRLNFADDTAFTAFAKWLGAPPGASRLLTFSPCTDSGGNNERLLVHAALVT